MFDVGGIRHKMPLDVRAWTFDPRSPPFVQSGQILAQGRRRLGDFLFVNRMAYNFRRPVRGDVIVFSTQDVRYPNVRTNDHYIKRLVALPGEKVSLRSPYLEINGTKLTEPEPFRRLLTESGLYAGIGYSAPGAMDAWLAPQNQPRTLSATQYLPFGDNTDHSLDGRYFGPIEQKRLVGPALCVYWPFGSRWGLIR
jgi:signal peptidase I